MLRSKSDKRAVIKINELVYSIPARTHHQHKILVKSKYLVPSHTVPPRVVKSPIRKPGDFGEDIENALKNDIKRQKIQGYETTVR
jgi:hypothetical protein